jgi:hypothetical protein
VTEKRLSDERLEQIEQIRGKDPEFHEILAMAEELVQARRVLTWYAWPDRYLPRYEGVGRVGIGSKYSPRVEGDMGALAREALGEEGSKFVRNFDIECTNRLLSSVRAEARVREEEAKALRERVASEDR